LQSGRSDVQARIAFGDGTEQAPEVEPDGLRIVRIAALEGMLEGLGGQQAAEDVGQEVREQGGFLEMVGVAGSDEAGPVLEFGLPGARLLREVERPRLLAQDFRVEERFGFESHLPGGRLGGGGKKPSPNIQHPTSNTQHRTSNLEL
jgi:hypothetical protein